MQMNDDQVRTLESPLRPSPIMINNNSDINVLTSPQPTKGLINIASSNQTSRNHNGLDQNSTSKLTDSSTDSKKNRQVNENNFFVRKQEIQAERMEQEKAELIREQEKIARQRLKLDNKRAMSREDLLHLLQDSVDKSSKTKIDKFIAKNLEAT